MNGRAGVRRPRGTARLARLARQAAGIFFATTLLPAPAAPAAPAGRVRASAPELRAVWVDAFHAGIRTPAEAEQLVAEAVRANLNTLFVQVRRHGDAFYARRIEPSAADPAYDPAFDALAHIVSVAHKAGLKVHAWINAMVVWRGDTAPADASHVFNRHGPGVSADARWLSSRADGSTAFPVGFFLDPGHPGVQEHLARVFLNVVREYDVDGIHFDYVRYPETETSLPRGADVGYNPTSLARFRQATGRDDAPLPGDEAWMAWRRRQVTDLVRRVYLEAKTVKPSIVVSAAVIPWGEPPTSEDDFADAAPMQLVFQDWHGWLREGLIDLAVPMNYARETDARERSWFDGWIAWEREHRHGGQIAIGLAAYLNSPQDVLAQIARVRTPAGNDRFAGMSLFSYAVPSAPAPGQTMSTSAPPPAAVPAGRLAYLAKGAPPAGAAFAQPAAAPAFAGASTRAHGAVCGIVMAPPGSADDVAVTVSRVASRQGTVRARTDGNGFFGVTGLVPGKYRVRLEAAGLPPVSRVVHVARGRVTRADLDAGRATH